MQPEQSPNGTRVVRWQTLERRTEGSYRIFDMQRVWRRHPLTGESAEFIVLHTPEWVNVIPLTTDGRVVLVRQYRHGTDTVTLEIPGGVVAPGESTAEAAMRECTEETGYAGSPETLELVAVHRPNPAFLDTKCSTYLWRDCTLCAEPRWDAHEVIEVFTATPDEVDNLILAGVIDHSIIIASWMLYRLRSARSHIRGGV